MNTYLLVHDKRHSQFHHFHKLTQLTLQYLGCLGDQTLDHVLQHKIWLCNHWNKHFDIEYILIITGIIKVCILEEDNKWKIVTKLNFVDI